MSVTNLMVPKGTSSQKLAQAQLVFVDNGVIVTKVFVVEEAGRPPVQLSQSLLFSNDLEGLESIKGDVRS